VEAPSRLSRRVPLECCDPEEFEWGCVEGDSTLALSANGRGFSQLAITAADLKKHITWVRGGMKSGSA
jgi:hypothetical protein